MKNNTPETLLVVLSLAGAVFLWTVTAELPETAALFPRIVLGIIVASALWIAVDMVRSRTRVTPEGAPEEEPEGSSAASPEGLAAGVTEGNTRRLRKTITVVSLALYAVLIPIIGFYVATALFLGVMYWVTWGYPRQASRILLSAVVAVLATAAVYGVFGILLNVGTPEGLLF